MTVKSPIYPPSYTLPSKLVLYKLIFRACCGAPTDSDTAQLKSWVESYEDQEALRAQLSTAQLVAFVPDGAVLPRAAGHLDTPLGGRSVVAFQSPSSLTTTVSSFNFSIIGFVVVFVFINVAAFLLYCSMYTKSDCKQRSSHVNRVLVSWVCCTSICQ